MVKNIAMLGMDGMSQEQAVHRRAYGCIFLITGFVSLLLLTGCKARTSAMADRLTSQRVDLPQQCAGWEKINLKNSSRYMLLQHDQRLVVNIDAHNLRGRNLGCWQ